MVIEYLPQILPCPCGKLPGIVGMRPEGRARDVYRVICSCGNSPMQWSVSKPSAIRLWNSLVTVSKHPT